AGEPGSSALSSSSFHRQVAVRGQPQVEVGVFVEQAGILAQRRGQQGGFVRHGRVVRLLEVANTKGDGQHRRTGGGHHPCAAATGGRGGGLVPRAAQAGQGGGGDRS